MILKAQIVSIDYNTGSCQVHIPQFDIASSTTASILSAQFCEPPGVYKGYNVSDLVWVAFEKNLIDEPVVIGHLGVPTMVDSAKGGALLGQTLDIQTRAQLPKETFIKTAESDYDSLVKIINKVKGLEEITKAAGDLPTLLESYQNTLNLLDTKIKEAGNNNTGNSPVSPPSIPSDYTGTYTNLTPLSVDLGGIKAANHPNGFNKVPITDVLDELLYPYQSPVITNFAVDPTTGLQLKGTDFNLKRITANITKKSKPVTKIEAYLNNTCIGTQTTLNISNATPIEFTFDDIVINSSGTQKITLKVYDETDTAVEQSASYTFIYPRYFGVSDATTIDAGLLADIKYELQNAKNFNHTYTTDKQFPFVAYPKASGNNLTVVDMAGQTQTWTRHEIKHTINGNEVDYLLYTGESSLVTKYKYTFTISN